MYVRKIQYTDFHGNKREDEFYFNLNKAEVIKWLTTTGDYTLDKVLQKVAKERNGKQIIEIFEDMLKMSYGKPSLDGIKFEKSDEIWDDFYRSDAYSELFTELVTVLQKLQSLSIRSFRKIWRRKSIRLFGTTRILFRKKLKE